MSKRTVRKRRRRINANKLLGFLLVMGIFFSMLSGETSLADVEPDVILSTETYTENVEKYKDDVVAISGTITSVGFRDDKLWVVVDNSVSCFFNGKDAERAYDECVVGNPISVKGKGCGFIPDVSYEQLSNCCLL